MNEDIKFLQEFATKHKLVFEDEGEAGFGRECVGLIKGTNWLDYNPMDMDTYDVIDGMDCQKACDLAPEDAYHKHECFAVLGRGKEAISQLATWVRDLEKEGELEVVQYNTGATGMQAMLTGVYGHALVIK